MSSEDDEPDTKVSEPSEDVLAAVDDLYFKAGLLSESTGKTAQQLVVDFSIYNGYSLDSRERCISYLQRKPEGKWIFMTTRKIEDEIQRINMPLEAELPPWVLE